MKTDEKRTPALGGTRDSHPQTCRPAPQSGDREDGGDSSIPLGEHPLLTEFEVAEVCGCSRWTVRPWKDRGLLCPLELPFGMRRNLYRRVDVEAFLAGLGAQRGSTA